MTKKKPPTPEQIQESQKRVEQVVEQLEGVSLSIAASIVTATEKVATLGEQPTTITSGSAVLDGPQDGCSKENDMRPPTFSMGSGSSKSKKFRRIQRRGPQHNEACDTGQLDETGKGGGKRKDYMEIDDMDGLKKVRVEGIEEPSTYLISVAAVAEQPREQQ